MAVLPRQYRRDLISIFMNIGVRQTDSKCSNTNVYARNNEFRIDLRLAIERDLLFLRQLLGNIRFVDDLQESKTRC
jgi:hypothetical protein